MRETTSTVPTTPLPSPAARLAAVPSTGSRLVLFDIDGTLISTGGRAGAALGQALEETYGTPVPSATYRYAGKTDPQIVFELMASVGCDRPAVAPLLTTALERYVGALSDALTPGTVMVLPGVEELLGRLAKRTDIRLGLLTGNVAAGAAVKLGAAGLAGYFTVGAFGSDDEDRNRLVPLARERAAVCWHEPFPGSRTVVVGDAEADIVCARAGGARAVAVASGPTPRERLAALAPDALFDSLADPGVLEALLGPGSPGVVESQKSKVES
jgi:phosphoglycolate phosphatase-like HAD superfamily hydrolase